MFNICRNLFACCLRVLLLDSSHKSTYLRNILDLPCQPGINNSLDGGNYLYVSHNADDRPGG